MLLDLGHEVGGSFDVGSKQRRKIPGVTDREWSMDDFEIVLLHQVPEYCSVMEDLLKKGKRVILSSFGQADTWQYEACGRICRDFDHAWVTPYSIKDASAHVQHGAPEEKVRMIRFGKYLTDYEPWTGGSGVIYSSCNSIHKRGHGCGWHLMEGAMKDLPISLSGKETQEVGGMGEIAEERMRELYRSSDAFLSFGTAPAAVVLTQIEAWCSGCPTAIFDNGHGISGEGMRGIVSNRYEVLLEECRRLIADPEYRQSRHRDSLANAAQFDIKSVGPKWDDLIREVMSKPC